MTLSHLDPHSSHMVPTRVAELIRAEVTAHSESHFYAGLRGDVFRAGGVFIATYRDAKVGDSLLVELMIDERRVVAKGVVRWRTPGGTDLPPGFGMSLLELSDEDRAVIEQFCARRPPFYFDLGGDRPSII